jgi:hypothetical protein
MTNRLLNDGSAWDQQQITKLNHLLGTALPGEIDTDIAAHVASYHEAAPNSQTGATYTFAAADARRMNIFDRATAQTITIPTNASVAFPIGTTLRCLRDGAGLVTFTPDTGVTLNKPVGIKPNRFMGAMVKKSADQTGADYTASPNIAFDAEVYDTDGFHDNSVTNTRLSIPSGLGIKRVKSGGRVRIANMTTNLYAQLGITKTGAFAYDGSTTLAATSSLTIRSVSIASGPFDVIGGTDYLELNLGVETPDTSVDLTAAQTSFWLEVTEIDAQGTITYQHGFVDLLKIGTNEWTIMGPGLG